MLILAGTVLNLSSDSNTARERPLIWRGDVGEVIKMICKPVTAFGHLTVHCHGRCWRQTDAEWNKVKADSETNGPLAAHIDSYFMDPTSFSALK